MLKSLVRASILKKFNNATFHVCKICLRHFYEKAETMQANNSRNFEKSPAFCDNNHKKDMLSHIRKWIPIEQNSKSGFTFTLLNYNILSQSLLDSHSYLYRENDTSSLKWNNRLYNIIGDIFKTNPSICCCQVRNIKIFCLGKNLNLPFKIYFYFNFFDLHFFRKFSLAVI